MNPRHSLFERHPSATLAVLLLLFLCLALAGAELGARALYPIASGQGFYEHPDDGRAFGLKPGYHDRLVNIEFNVDVAINDFGLRDDRALADILAANGTRLLFMGDSFTFGYGVEFGQMYSTVLERLLRAKGFEAACFSAGYADGWGPVQFEHYLKMFYDRLQPDIVVVGLFPQNDLHDHEIIEIVDHGNGTVEQRLKGLQIVDGHLGIKKADEGPLDRLKIWLGLRSALYKRLSTAKARLLLRLQSARRNATAQAETILPYYFLDGAPREGDHRFREALQALLDMDRFLKERGKRLLVFCVPSSFQIAEAYQFAMAKYYNYDVGLMAQARDRLEPQTWIASFLRNHGVAVVDPSRAFQVLDAPSARLYFDYDAHWTPTGHEAAARLLFDALTNNGTRSPSVGTPPGP